MKVLFFVAADSWSVKWRMESQLKDEVPRLLTSLLNVWAQKHAPKDPFKVQLLLCHDELVTSGGLC